MDFARKQLEKYGWTDGKGLGKHENGISEALKPKLKRSVAGVGHDMAADFTEHWWSALYDKAAGNVQVEEKHGKTKKIKTKDNKFEITNSTWSLTKKKKDSKEEEYGDYFVKTAVLANGGSRTEKLRDSESEEDEKLEEEKRDALKMTDEELFAACGGRTAHKGARHGLKALGKLARIERQEQMMLIQPQYNGYSHAKKLKNKVSSVNDLQLVEEMNLNSDGDSIVSKKKKKKRKNCLSNNQDVVSMKTKMDESNDIETIESLSETHENSNETDANINSEEKSHKKSKKSKRKNKVDCEDYGEKMQADDAATPNKKKKKQGKDDVEESSMNIEETQDALEKRKKKKKKKVD